MISLLHVLLFLLFAARSNVFCAILRLPDYPNVRLCTGVEDPESVNFANPAHSFRFVRMMYKGCTHVMGSVVLNNLYGDLDLSFLNTIVEIGGSLIIINNRNVELLSFEKLAIIRGQVPYNFGRSKLSLLISHNVMNGTLGIISLPSLTAVKKHDIRISKNRGYCYLHFVDWGRLKEERGQYFYWHIRLVEWCHHTSVQCDSSCTKLIGGRQLCYGNSSKMCQKNTQCFSRVSCGSLSRCYLDASGKESCCHKECAGGCSGETPSDCFACKNQRLGSKCRAACPKEKSDPDHSLAFSGFCVKQCPKYYLEDNGQCVAHCTPGQSYYLPGETRCLACEPGVSACQHCQQRKLEEDLLLRKPSMLGEHNFLRLYDKKMKRMMFTPRSILVALKNCKTYDGDIVVNRLSNIPVGNLEEHVRVEDFENLKNLEHLNGQLSLMLLSYPTVQNLTFLSNLKSINSPYSDYAKRGLLVMGPAMEYLGLQSLKSVNVKDVAVVASPKLCYMENFKERFNSDTKVISRRLKDAKQCKNEGKVCDASCSSKGCWGPGPSMCV